MRLYQVGPDVLAETITRNYLWVVYWYKAEDYGGDGEAISFNGTFLEWHTLNHCSCFSPEDSLNGGLGTRISLEDFDSDYVIDRVYRPEVVEKVRELMAN